MILALEHVNPMGILSMAFPTEDAVGIFVNMYPLTEEQQDVLLRVRGFSRVVGSSPFIYPSHNADLHLSIFLPP